MDSSVEDASPMSRLPLAAFFLCSVLLPGLGHASDTPACASTQEVTRIEKDLVVVGKDVSIHACDHVLGDVVVIVGTATVAGRVDGDVVVVFGYLCAAHGPLPEPSLGCGVDRTADELLCDEYSPCD